MSEKTIDKRIVRTKKIIKSALIEMMEDQMINEISVLQLCKKADINRNTFYAHYSTPEDVLEEIEKELFEEYKAVSSGISGTSTEVLHYLRDHRTVFLTLMENRSSKISTYITDYSSKLYEEFWEESGIERNYKNLRILRYIESGNYRIVAEWLEGGCTQPEDEINELIKEMQQLILGHFGLTGPQKMAE